MSGSRQSGAWGRYAPHPDGFGWGGRGGLSAIGRTSPHGAVEHGLEQHLGAGGAVFPGRVFDFVVTDAVLARDEDHAGRGDPGDIDGVMAGAGNDVAPAMAALLGGAAHGGNASLVERRGRELPEIDDICGAAGHFGDRREIGTQPVVHRRQRRVVGMAADRR